MSAHVIALPQPKLMRLGRLRRRRRKLPPESDEPNYFRFVLYWLSMIAYVWAFPFVPAIVIVLCDLLGQLLYDMWSARRG